MCVARDTATGEQRQASPWLTQGFKHVPVNESTHRHFDRFPQEPENLPKMLLGVHHLRGVGWGGNVVQLSGCQTWKKNQICNVCLTFLALEIREGLKGIAYHLIPLLLGGLGSPYGRIRNCGSGVEAEHLWPVWNRQEQRAAEWTLASGTGCEGAAPPNRSLLSLSLQHVYHGCQLQASHFLGAGTSEDNRQGVYHTETHVLEKPGETPGFSRLLFDPFRPLLKCDLLWEALPDHHSIVAPHLPSVSIPLIYFPS